MPEGFPDIMLIRNDGVPCFVLPIPYKRLCRFAGWGLVSASKIGIAALSVKIDENAITTSRQRTPPIAVQRAYNGGVFGDNQPYHTRKCQRG